MVLFFLFQNLNYIFLNCIYNWKEKHTGGHRSGKQLFLSWIYSSLTSAGTQPVNITLGTLTWKLVSSLFILYLINIYGEAVCRELCILQTCSSICLVNLSTELYCQDCKLSTSKMKLIWPLNLFLHLCFLSQ